MCTSQMGITNTSTQFKIKTKIACWFLPMFLKKQKQKQTKEIETKKNSKNWTEEQFFSYWLTPCQWTGLVAPAVAALNHTGPAAGFQDVFTLKIPTGLFSPWAPRGMLYLHSLALAITAGKQGCCTAQAKMKRGKDQVHTNISLLSSLDFIFPV